MCVLSSVVSLIESFLSILALLVITTWSSTLRLVFRLFFLVLFVSQGGFTAESLIVVFQLVELALYPYRVCVCVLYSVFSLIPLYSCSLSISYLVYVIFRLFLLVLFFQKKTPCDRVLTCASPPPPPLTHTPSPFFFPCFPFFSPPSFSNFLFFSTDSFITGYGLCWCARFLSSVFFLLSYSPLFLPSYYLLSGPCFLKEGSRPKA